MNLEPVEATVLLDFLDRVSIAGHDERKLMNHLVKKLTNISQDKEKSDAGSKTLPV